METKYDSKRSRNEHFINMVRKNMLHSEKVMDHIKKSAKIPEQMAYEEFVEDYLTDIHRKNETLTGSRNDQHTKEV